MSRYAIIPKGGGEPRFVGCPTYNGTYLKPAYVEFREIASPVPVAWEVGDYLYYGRLGLTFRLYHVPDVKKQARSGSYGAAFVYENVQLFAATKDLELTPFRDFVRGDNGIHYSSRKGASTYEAVAGIADRLQACMDALHPGEWEFRVTDLHGDVDIAEVKEFAIDGSCLDALQRIYDTWDGIGWVHTVEERDGGGVLNVVTVGAPNVRTGDNTTDPFLYGKGKGLKLIRRTVTNKDDIATRIYPFGSERNLPLRYYNGKDIRNADSVDIPNLMLPLSSWGLDGDGKPDPEKAYIDAPADVVSRLGVIPKRVYFDGSDGLDEIYPSIEKVTIGEVRAASPDIVPAQGWSDTDRVDVLTYAQRLGDPGYSSDENGNIYMTRSDVAVAASTHDLIFGTRQDFDRTFTVLTADIGSPAQRIDLSDVAVSFRLNSVRSYTATCILVAATADEDGAYAATVRKSFGITLTASGTRTTGKLPAEMSISAGSGRVITNISINVEIGLETDSVAYETAVVTAGSLRYGLVSYVASTFKVRIPQVGFDLNAQAALGSGITLAMKDGTCAGREFPVTRCEYLSDSDEWILTLKRAEDSSLNVLFPNNNGYQIAAGDHFVILDIAMPELYVGIAAVRLLAVARKELEDLYAERVQYEPEVDPIVMAREGRHLHEGMFMKIDDADVVGGTEYVTIDSLTIDEGEAAIPTYKVTLRDKKREGIVSIINAARSMASNAAAMAARNRMQVMRFVNTESASVT